MLVLTRKKEQSIIIGEDVEIMVLGVSGDKVRLGITAPRLLELGLIDKVVREPLGGAHRNPHSMAVRLKAVLLGQLNSLEQLDTTTLLEQRYQRLRSYGAFKVG